MPNPFERRFSMTSGEEEGLKKEGKTPQQIAEAKKKLEEATSRSQRGGAPETEELGTSDVRQALEEIEKYSK
ncbi:MAG: hypothetical protein AAB378_00385 [Patescibacteria group bacterium]